MASQKRIFPAFRCFVLSVAVGLSVLFASCLDKDNYLFDYEYVKGLYERTFPVKDIDPDQDWKTTNLISVSVSVNLEYGETYSLIIYSANPLNNQEARVLGKGSVENGKSFSMKINCPKDRPSVFISCKDGKGKLLVQQFKVNGDGTVNAAFGTVTSRNRSVASRGINTEDYTVQFSDFNLGDLDLIRVEENRYTFDDAVQGVPASEYVWIPKGYAPITRNIISALGGKKILLIDGDLDITGDCQIPVGLKIVVAGRFTANVTEIFTLGKQGSKIIILEGGTVDITAGGRSIVSFIQDDDTLPVIYNAGVLKINFGDGNQDVSGNPIIYNCGTATIDNITARVTIVNVKTFNISENANLNEVRNFCYFAVGGELAVRNVIVGDRARLNASTLKLDNSLMLGDNAIVDAGIYSASNATSVSGGTNEYPAVLLVGKFNVSRPVAFSGVVYVSEKEDGEGSGYAETSTNIEYFLPIYNAGIKIEGTDCNGNGYNADPVPPVVPDPPTDPTDPPTDPPVDPEPPVKPDPEPEPEPEPDPEPDLQSYTFCYEDYYPQAGDYDFNDAVMDMTYEPIKDNGSTVNKLIVNVTLAAVGANYQLGGALQLVGISKGDVSSVTVSGASFNDNARTLFKKDWESETSGEPNVVVPLFNDAHYVLTGQNTNRYLFNTARGHEGYADATPVTFKVEVEFSGTNVADIDLNNLDLFIARPTISDNGYYENQQGRTRVEIHLYEFWGNITSKSVDFAGNIAAAGNRTWAICAPGFRYPYEGTTITTAYPDFASWAQSHNSNLDWYKNPKSEHVYR